MVAKHRWNDAPAAVETHRNSRPRLAAGDLEVLPHERWCHRPRGNHKAFDDKAAKNHRQGERDNHRLQRIDDASCVVRWSGC